MTTFTISNPEIEEKYTADEIKSKFLFFIQSELKEESIDLYEVSVLPDNVLETYNDFKNISFVKR